MSESTRCRAENEVVLEDGRLSLEQELRDSDSRQFNVLALDAFSGDAISAHLPTREAFGIYVQHLRSDGLLAVHASNRHPERAEVRSLGKFARDLRSEPQRKSPGR